MVKIPSIVNINLEAFDQLVLEASQAQPVLVDFWAEWCAPCLFIAPTLESVIMDYQGRIRLAKIEVDEGENMKLAGRYQVRGFPTIVLFEQGREKGRFSSAQSKAFIIDFIEKNSQFLNT